jgi:flagellin
MTRINTNIPSIVARGRMRNNLYDLNTRLVRLSTGLRINRGADDPAGLIASEVLRSEIGGIKQAIANSDRAINMLSTVEGALNEVSALLMDIKSLVVGMANEGAVSPDEIAANQFEIDSIIASIDRIANTTQFAGKKLLNGSLDYALSGVSTSALASVEVYSARLLNDEPKTIKVEVIKSAETGYLTFDGTVTGDTTSSVTIELAGWRGTEILSFTSGTTFAQIRDSVNSVTAITGVSATTTAGELRLDSIDYGSDAYVSVKGLTNTFVRGGDQVDAGVTRRDEGVDTGVLVNGQQADTGGVRVDIRTNTFDARLYLDPTFATQDTSVAVNTTFYVTGGGSLFQITPEVSPLGQINVGLRSISTANLGNTVLGYLNTIKSGGVNAVNQGNYVVAEDIINEAINQAAVYRGRLGSLEKNQIQTNISSQQIALENVTASESVIRDADMAEEVSALTRAQILVQATQLTLTIANQQPQITLGLLGG